VYEVRDWLRKDVITAEVGADRSARLNEQHEGLQPQLRAQTLKLEGTMKELQCSIKTADKRAKAEFALGVVCSECKIAGLQDYKAHCHTCLDCAIDDALDLGHWPVASESEKTEAAATTATEQANTTATATEIADDLKEAEHRKEKEEDTRLEDAQQLASLSLQKLKKAEEADRVAKEKAKLAFASIQVSPEPEAAKTSEGSSETKKKKKKKKAKDLQELKKQQLQSPSKN
jgi:hypothetical protein